MGMLMKGRQVLWKVCQHFKMSNSEGVIVGTQRLNVTTIGEPGSLKAPDGLGRGIGVSKRRPW